VAKHKTVVGVIMIADRLTVMGPVVKGLKVVAQALLVRMAISRVLGPRVRTRQWAVRLYGRLDRSGLVRYPAILVIEGSDRDSA
jgi:hypothetical protein